MDGAEQDEHYFESPVSDHSGHIPGGVPSVRGRRSREAMDSSLDVSAWSRQKLENVCKFNAIKGYSGK